MPWEVKKNDKGEHCVHNMDTGRKVACHPTRDKAMAQMRALHANVDDKKSIFGDALQESERDTWKLWEAVRKGAQNIAQAARAESITGTAVDVKKKVQELVDEYASELRPVIAAQVQDYLQSDTDDQFYLKSVKPGRTGNPAMNPMLSDTLTFAGGTVKALGNGRVGGYLVVFSGPEDPDLQGDYFTKGTDFLIDSGEQRPILYRHGIHPVIKSKKLGKATLKIDDVGVFVEGELDVRDKYIAAIYHLAEKGKLGWSSGSMTHLVSRAANGKSFEIVSWPIGEASLTPAPVEGRTAAVAVKDLGEDEFDLDDAVKSLDQDEYDQRFSIDGIPSIKAFCEAVAPNSLKDGSQRSESAANAAKEFITITKVLGEAYDSYASRLVKRTESRFLKQGREIDPSTVKQVESTLADMDRISMAFSTIKESLGGIKKISDMTVAEQRAMSERARLELWNFCRISGLTPEEIEYAGTSTS